jgi:hypothetical protein
MDAKLTLKLDSNIIEKAKIYARKKNMSLSRLIESYLDFLTQSANEKNEVTPLVKSLSGVMELPPKYDRKKEYKDHLLKKYSK